MGARGPGGGGGWCLVGLALLGGSAWSAPARADEPAPVPEVAPLGPRERLVLVGPDLGVALLRAKGGSGVTYEPGFAWGGHARLELRPWLGLRLSARHSEHVVDLARGALVSDADASAFGALVIEHPPLDAWLLAARLEPTWVVSSRLRLWLGAGVGWLRLEVEPATGELPACDANCELFTAKRSGVGLELSGALGATLDVVPRWVTVSLAVSGAGLTRQSGRLYEPVQGFVAGSMLHLEGLPQPSGSYAALGSVDVIF